MNGSPSREHVDEALRALRRGEVIVYPTETLYGLGADATDEVALGRVLALKVRPDGKPISVLIARREMLEQIVSGVTARAERLIERFWPGPLTLIFTARPGIPEAVTAGTGTVGVRVSSHPIAAALVSEFGRPLTATSANPAGAPPALALDRARAYFGEHAAVYVDGGTLADGPASTVVDVTDDEARVLRDGAIPARAIHAALAEAA
jgi:L-threonylcarbamoyladenylate synthase